MLDVSLHGIVYKDVLRGIDLTFPRGTHTAIAGLPGSGASTFLKLISGELRPDRGEVRIGARIVNDLKPARRPVLYVTSALDVPGRWSVQHALIAAVRYRTLDRVDRQREYELALAKWHLERLISQRVASLSSTETTLVHLARIELLRPGIVVADRLLERLNTSTLVETADAFYRALRIIGATVISAPSSRFELGLTDSVAVLDEGRIAQHGSSAHVYVRPASEAAARATGEANVIPITIRGTVVESPIGSWEIASAPFQGNGVALARPEEFTVARPGEESDLIFGVEEASFVDGRWMAAGILTGGLMLRVALPSGVEIHKGKLLALRYDGSRFRVIRREGDIPARGVPTDVVPPLGETG